MDRMPVFDFDYQTDPGLRSDVHATYLKLKHEAPQVFWTPRNGGHWIATSAAACIRVLQHPEIFSSKYLSIPPEEGQAMLIPESLDPPEHRAYRQLLRPFFESKAIAPLEPRIVEWTERLIGEVADLGECEFVDALASRLPVSVFMEMFGFPLERFEYFRSLVTGFFNAQTDAGERARLAGEIMTTLNTLIEARRLEPRDDLISTLVTLDFEGRELTQGELLSIGFLMFLAGLDTVTNAMSFGMRHLANDAALRQRMIDNPACIPAAIEELMRRYTFVSTARYLVDDAELGGAQLRKGDSILVPLHMVGWDEALTSDPETVSLDRPTCKHAGFGSGIHTCLGIHLARLELAVFYRVWFARIGHFEMAEGETTMRGGTVQAVESLHLRWAR